MASEKLMEMLQEKKQVSSFTYLLISLLNLTKTNHIKDCLNSECVRMSGLRS